MAALNGKKLYHYKKRCQGMRQTCALYCIYHILTRTSAQHSMDIFKDDLDFNDRLVLKLVSSYFNIA